MIIMGKTAGEQAVVKVLKAFADFTRDKHQFGYWWKTTPFAFFKVS